MDSCTGVVTVIAICSSGDENDIREGMAHSSTTRCGTCRSMIGQGAYSSVVTGSVPAGATGGVDRSSCTDVYIAGGTWSTNMGSQADPQEPTWAGPGAVMRGLRVDPYVPMWGGSYTCTVCS